MPVQKMCTNKSFIQSLQLVSQLVNQSISHL